MSQTLKKHILNLLKEKAVNKKTLVQTTSSLRRVSIQAVYKAIRELKQDEKILEKAKQISLNKVWIEKELRFFNTAKANYTDLQVSGTGFGQLEEGDKVSYSFSNPNQLDQVWGDFFMVFGTEIEQNTPIMIYNPYFWFPLARRESEIILFNWLQEKGKKVYLSSGSNTALNRKILKEFFQGTKHSYSISENLGFAENYYVNIFGNYLIEVKLDPDVTKDMGQFFQGNTKITAGNKKELLKVVGRKGKNRLVVSRNAKKAARLRKRLAKDFFIPKESREYV